MALTITLIDQPWFNGNKREGIYTVAFDSSYPSGGEALTASAIGLSEILQVTVQPNNLASSDYIYGIIYTSSSQVNLTIHYPTGGTAPAAVAAPAFTTTSGATTVTGSAAVAAAITEVAGRGVELADTTDASTLTVRVRILGK